MSYYYDDSEGRKVINYPNTGSSEHKHKKERIYATTRGLEKKCGGNDNPNADPEILVCQGGLESLWGAPQIQSFEFVTGIIESYGFWDANLEPIFAEQRLTKGPIYNTGDQRGNILICTVHFSEPVFVTGNPQLEILLIEPGATANQTLLRANFESMETREVVETEGNGYWNSIEVAEETSYFYYEGEVITPVSQKVIADQYLYPNGSSSITFTLMPTINIFGFISPGQWATDSLFSISANAIDLNGGTIKDVGGVNADITNSSSRGSSAGHVTVFQQPGSLWVNF